MDERTNEEIQAHLGGAVATARTFLEHLKAGRIEEAWPMADHEWRLARAQDWLWNNRADPLLANAGLDVEAALAVADAPATSWWPSFIEEERQLWTAGLEFYNPATWRPSFNPIPVDVDYELVIEVDVGVHALPPEAGGDRSAATSLQLTSDDSGQWWLQRAPDPPLAVAHLEVLLHAVDRRWLIAALGPQRYRPGWPPTLADGTPTP